ICSVGAKALRSSKVASATPTTVPLVRRENSRVPQSLQNTRSSASDDGKRAVSPATESARWSNSARAKNGEPIAFWQLRQWQMRTLSGSPSVLNRTAPHRHPPSRMAPISIRRPAAGNVEHRAGRECTILRCQPGDHRREFFHQHKPCLRYLRQHEVNVLLRHLVEDRGL